MRVRREGVATFDSSRWRLAGATAEDCREGSVAGTVASVDAELVLSDLLESANLV